MPGLQVIENEFFMKRGPWKTCTQAGESCTVSDKMYQKPQTLHCASQGFAVWHNGAGRTAVGRSCHIAGQVNGKQLSLNPGRAPLEKSKCSSRRRVCSACGRAKIYPDLSDFENFRIDLPDFQKFTDASRSKPLCVAYRK